VDNTRFEAMLSYYLVEPEFCNVASGWGKGLVEKNVQDSRRRIWQDAQAQRFGSFTELNLWLLSRCRWLWNWGLESGNVSVEHVQNVLYRLSALPEPDTVETALTVQEAPTSDTRRYDALREEVDHAA
jgi:hypothetical protein